MQMHSCRLCSNPVAPAVSVASFRADIPGKLGRVLNLPVTEGDGLLRVSEPWQGQPMTRESLLIVRYQRLIPLAQRHNLQGTRKRPKVPVVLMSLPLHPRQDLQLSVLPQALQEEDCVSLLIMTVRQIYE